MSERERTAKTSLGVFHSHFTAVLLAVTRECDVTGNINYISPIKPRPV